MAVAAGCQIFRFFFEIKEGSLTTQIKEPLKGNLIGGENNPF